MSKLNLEFFTPSVNHAGLLTEFNTGGCADLILETAGTGVGSVNFVSIKG